MHSRILKYKAHQLGAGRASILKLVKNSVAYFKISEDPDLKPFIAPIPNYSSSCKHLSKNEQSLFY